MFLEIQIIASGVGGLKEIIHQYEDGVLIAPGDAEVLSHTIEKLYRNEPLRKKLAQNARLKVLSRYSPSAMINQYIETYDEVLRYGEKA